MWTLLLQAQQRGLCFGLYGLLSHAFISENIPVCTILMHV